MQRSIRRSHRWLLALGFGIAGAMGIAPLQAQQLCGGASYPFPYTDVASVGAAFCPGIMEAYVTGVSKGTTPTTFSPNATVTRVQMTTFLQRSLDAGLARSSRRAALNQWWTPQTTAAMQSIALLGHPINCAADGENIWVSTYNGDEVVEVQAHTGTVLGTWTGAAIANGVVVAAGKVFVTGYTSPGSLYVVDPTQPPGALTSVAILGNDTEGIAFDGTNLWTANQSGSVSIITPQSPYTVTPIATGFSSPYGIVYDGANIWVTDRGTNKLFKLDASGTILQTIAVGVSPDAPVFDGTNIWVPNFNDNSITVVQASSGNVVATLTTDASNLLSGPTAASFDGERILVTNQTGSSVSVFKAADLSFIANVTTGASTVPFGACSDGVNFWVPLADGLALLRF
jgi:outer membrane protein assembly factor BamB